MASPIKKQSIRERIKKWLSARRIYLRTNALGIFFVSLYILWLASLILGAFIPEVRTLVNNKPIEIYGTIIQDTLALLGISIAVIIFRIQGLGNQKQMIEQNTIDYVYRLNGWVYTTWNSYLVESIENEAITQSYLERRLRSSALIARSGTDKIREDTKNQQQGLKDNLDKHTKIDELINRTKGKLIFATIFLLLPP